MKVLKGEVAHSPKKSVQERALTYLQKIGLEIKATYKTSLNTVCKKKVKCKSPQVAKSRNPYLIEDSTQTRDEAVRGLCKSS
jgi:hypothetical protein